MILGVLIWYGSFPIFYFCFKFSMSYTSIYEINLAKKFEMKTSWISYVLEEEEEITNCPML